MNLEKVFTIGQKLGEGGFCEVYKGKFETGFEMAVKMYRKDGEVTHLLSLIGLGLALLSGFSAPVLQIEELKHEVEILKKCRHENLVSYYGYPDPCIFVP